MKYFLLFLLFFSISLSGANKKGRWRAHTLDLNSYSSLEDIKAEIIFGKKIAATILGRYKIHQNIKLSQYVAKVGSALVALVGRSELKYHFCVIDSSDINAFATPGGYIFVTSAAMTVMGNEAELAGVLAHEIIHVNQKHIVKKLRIKGADDSIGSDLAKVISGDANILKVLNQGMDVLFDAGLEQKDEFESDRMAVDILSVAGYKWKSYLRFLKRVDKKLKKKQDQHETLSKTHPSIKRRIKKVLRYARKNRLKSKTGNIFKKRFAQNVAI